MNTQFMLNPITDNDTGYYHIDIHNKELADKDMFQRYHYDVNIHCEQNEHTGMYGLVIDDIIFIKAELYEFGKGFELVKVKDLKESELIVNLDDKTLNEKAYELAECVGREIL